MATERMYELAFQYKKTKLWQKLYDSEIFAIKLSDGEIGYCSVIGYIGEMNAVTVYAGPQEFQSFQVMLRLAYGGDMTTEANIEQLLSQNCTQCTFDSKDMLSPKEVEEVRAFAKAHGIRLGGPNAFPQFLRYQPCRYPWKVTSQLDRERICEALEASIFLAELLREKSKEDIGLTMLYEQTDTIPLLEKGKKGFVLKTTPIPPEMPVVYSTPTLSNELLAARVKKARKKGTLQCGAVRLPEPVQMRPDEAPYYPLVLIAAEEKTEMLLPPTLATAFEENPEQLLNDFAEMLLEQEACPSKIKVGDERTFALLENLCKATDISLQKAKRSQLALLEDAKNNLLEDMEEDEDEDEDDFDLMMTLSDDELKQLPKSFVRELLFLADEGGVPPEVEARLRRVFQM